MPTAVTNNPLNFSDFIQQFISCQRCLASYPPVSQSVSSVAQSCPTICDPMDCSTPGLPVHHQLPGFPQTLVHWVGDAIQPSHLLSSASPFAFNLSQHQGLFQCVSSLHQVAKYWRFSNRPFNEYSELISFRVDWLELLAVQGILKNLLQHHSSKPSILWCSAFFMVQLSHPYRLQKTLTCCPYWNWVPVTHTSQRKDVKSYPHLNLFLHKQRTKYRDYPAFMQHPPYASLYTKPVVCTNSLVLTASLGGMYHRHPH